MPGEPMAAKDVVDNILKRNNAEYVNLGVYVPGLHPYGTPAWEQTELYPISVPGFVSLGLDNLTREYCRSADEAVAVISSLNIGDLAFHIPQIDFSCPVNNDGLGYVMRSLSRLGGNGYVLDSGLSYHYYGQDVLTPEEWGDFMARVYEESEYFVEQSWIDESEARGFTALRITDCRSKEKVPQVVGRIRGRERDPPQKQLALFG